MSLKGKTLFITGGSRGIGLAIALRAARDGANVTIAAKTAEPHPKLPGTIYTSAREIRRSLTAQPLFVTGGSRGIGLAVALRAARAGATVTIAAKAAEPHPKRPGTISTSAQMIGSALPPACSISCAEV